MITLFVLFLSLFGMFQFQAEVSGSKVPSTITKLEFQEFLEPSTNELKPSAKLRGLQGKRVRLRGFMAQMEEQPEHYFYLCSRPIYCDESGGGIGDLPVDAVRVVLRKQQKFKSLSSPIEVIGTLELSGQSELEQDSWAVRVLAESYVEIHQPLKNSRSKQSRKLKQ